MTSDLEVILNDMHSAILEGDFAQLSNLIPTLEEAREVAELTGHPNPTGIREWAERNAICLQAAIFGVKAARRRIADITEAARGLTTYDRVGGKSSLSVVPTQSRRV